MRNIIPSFDDYSMIKLFEGTNDVYDILKADERICKEVYERNFKDAKEEKELMGSESQYVGYVLIEKSPKHGRAGYDYRLRTVSGKEKIFYEWTGYSILFIANSVEDLNNDNWLVSWTPTKSIEKFRMASNYGVELAGIIKEIAEPYHAETKKIYDQQRKTWEDFHKQVTSGKFQSWRNLEDAQWDVCVDIFKTADSNNETYIQDDRIQKELRFLRDKGCTIINTVGGYYNSIRSSKVRLPQMYKESENMIFTGAPITGFRNSYLQDSANYAYRNFTQGLENGFKDGYTITSPTLLMFGSTGVFSSGMSIFAGLNFKFCNDQTGIPSWSGKMTGFNLATRMVRNASSLYTFK